MLASSLVVSLLIALQAGLPSPLTLESLLGEMTDRSAITRVPVPSYTCRQASSYDRKSTTPDDAKTWFANGDYNQFIRVEKHDGRDEHVMIDVDGPGAVVRLWSANPEGVLRVYLDGADAPVIEAPMSDMLRGKWKIAAPLSAERARGCNLYLPIPYSKHCKITTDKGGSYYQINYRTFAAGTRVETLTTAALEHAATAIDRASKAIAAPTQEQTSKLLEGVEIAPGGSKDAALPSGPGAVSCFQMSIKAMDRDQAMRSTVVRMKFDGEETVWCPLGDLFALGPGIRAFNTWWIGADADGIMSLRFPMPYEKSASVTVENRGTQPVTIDVKHSTVSAHWDRDLSMHFHAAWRDQYPIHTRPMQDWNYITIQGAGVYIGDSLSLMNPAKEWWGEGDEKIYVDGEAFPSHFGTGTEDYYSYAWSSPEIFQGPFNAQPRSDGAEHGNNWGRCTVMRTRSLDAIPFTQSLRFDMEVWHWKECDVEYAATTYFYARPGATSNRSPDPAAASRKLVQPPPLPPPFKVNGAIECEKLAVVVKSDGVEAESQGGFDPELWSGQQQLWVRGKKIGDFVDVKVPAPDDKSRAITLYATKSWDYAIVRFKVNGQAASGDVDLCSGERRVVATGPIRLGVFEPKNGAFIVRAEIVGSNPKAVAPKTYFGLDCFVLEGAEAVKK